MARARVPTKIMPNSFFSLCQIGYLKSWPATVAVSCRRHVGKDSQPLRRAGDGPTVAQWALPSLGLLGLLTLIRGSLSFDVIYMLMVFFSVRFRILELFF